MVMLSMTDGVRKVYGIETYRRPIRGIQPSAPLGLKVKFSNVSVSKGIFSLLPENTIVLGGGLADDDSTHTVQSGNLWNTEANKDGVPPVSRPYKLPDFPITEGCSKTSGLVVCFGELLIDFVCIDESSGCRRDLGAKVGADESGYSLVDILKENNVDTSGMRVDSNGSTTLAYVELRPDRERKCSFFRNPGADMLLYESELDRKLIEKAKIFHYGSMSLIEEPCKSAHLSALRIAKDSDCILSYYPKLRLALWPSAEAARNGIMSIWHLADVIKISEDEITFLIDGGDPYDDDVVLEKLFYSNLKLLIVTGGSEGCRYYTKGFKGKVRGVNVKLLDTTGAGEAFVSGILYNIASDPSIFEDEERLQKALYFANVCGALTVTERGAITALPTKDAVLQFYAKQEHQL
ncbi:pfkB family carbohydrate kinase [Medicago truncatula]|uniref:PfkB family carbohydrate kinase n=1 Tax=Medicago truncatula TaxID=3880 RepID=A0A072VWK5_MEDTR|nr:pfkB family carbohydrate kinase [Medicago truncatula]